MVLCASRFVPRTLHARLSFSPTIIFKPRTPPSHAIGIRMVNNTSAIPPQSSLPASTVGVTRVDPASYDAQLAAKKEWVETRFAEFNPPTLEVFPSSPEHYRMRAEFTVWHDQEDMYYVMYEKNPETGDQQRVRVDSFPVASLLVNELMQKLLLVVKKSPVLRKKLFQTNFHTTLSGQSMVSMIYHRKLNDDWIEAAKELRTELAIVPGALTMPHIIGRSRKQKIVLDADQVEEELSVPGRDRQKMRYVQVEGAFSQPNAGVCCSMLGWAVEATRGSNDHDLLELYCGNGNFTAAIAPNFRRVVATEVSKSAVVAAKSNFKLNDIDNVFVARMSSEEFTKAWKSGQKYHRLEGAELASCNFQTLLVDPPRAGLDEQTVKLLDDFTRVVYISCNPETLARDISLVKEKFEMKRFAMFDQFPYSHHIECGVLLEKISQNKKRKLEEEDS